MRSWKRVFPRKHPGYAAYGYESEEAYKAAIDKEAYREYLLVEKTVGFLGESTVLRGEYQ